MNPRAEAAEFVTMWFGLAIIAIVIASSIALVLDHRQHRRTDPACVFHHPPVTALGRWRYERNRGRICPGCERNRRGALAQRAARHAADGRIFRGCPCSTCRDRARREVRHG